jgi:chitinase
MARIVGYLGALPLGVHAPPIPSIPINDAVDFYFTLAFTKDDSNDGLFSPHWDQDITPDVIEQAKQDNDTRKFLVSLGGATFPWPDPTDPEAWIGNAITSLGSLMETYFLDGIDVNYESGIGVSFAEAIGQVATGLKEQNGAIVSLAPYNATWEAYEALYDKYSESIDWINYQAYADDLDKQGYLDLYDRLAQTTGSYDKLTLGIASSTTPSRGLQPPEIYDVLTDLQEQGVGGAMIWSLEDSASYNPPFAIESTAEDILAGGSDE